jgi:hypothetical protein
LVAHSLERLNAALGWILLLLGVFTLPAANEQRAKYVLGSLADIHLL